jgi:hypothetical protein
MTHLRKSWRPQALTQPSTAKLSIFIDNTPMTAVAFANLSQQSRGVLQSWPTVSTGPLTGSRRRSATEPYRPSIRRRASYGSCVKLASWTSTLLASIPRPPTCGSRRRTPNRIRLTRSEPGKYALPEANKYLKYNCLQDCLQPAAPQGQFVNDVKMVGEEGLEPSKS